MLTNTAKHNTNNIYAVKTNDMVHKKAVLSQR